MFCLVVELFTVYVYVDGLFAVCVTAERCGYLLWVMSLFGGFDLVILLV